MSAHVDYASSKFLITGGAGFVSSYLIDLLLGKKAKHIVVFDNLESAKPATLEKIKQSPQIELIEGDVSKLEDVKKVCQDVDYCFHFASLKVNACRMDPYRAFDVISRGTQNLLESFKSTGIKKLIYTSTASIYGQAQILPTPETEAPYDNRTFYGACKFSGEQMLKSYYFMYGLPYLTLRLFNVYGPGMDCSARDSEVFIRWLKDIHEGKAPQIFGDPDTTCDFVYVTDVARALMLALESPQVDDVFNVGTGVETPLKDLLTTLQEINGQRTHWELVSQSWLNPVKRRVANIEKIRKALRFEPKVSIEEGLRNLSVWFSENHKK
jgi:UDP-glucose 4-epimerase